MAANLIRPSKLADFFQRAFPDAKVKEPDPPFAKLIKTAPYFAENPRLPIVVYGWEERFTSEYQGALSSALSAPPLSGSNLLTLVKFFSWSGSNFLRINTGEAPAKHGEEFEKNVLLGHAEIDGVRCWIFLEHEWKNVNGVMRKEIHPHARPVAKQKWDDEDHLSIVTLV